MPLYVAFGSNMHRLRLERRIGAVIDHGRVVLPGYCHGFTKLGRDGTGKGNVAPAPGRDAHGVLYEITDAQVEVLAEYEPGYERVTVPARAGSETLSVLSFVSPMWIPGLLPSREYVGHYWRGMREHRLPLDYMREVIAAARGLRG